MDMNKLDLETLLELLGAEADGHYTIFKFSTNYKVGVGTPINNNVRAFLYNYPAFPTLKEAVVHAILSGMSFDSDHAKRVEDFGRAIGFCFECNQWRTPETKQKQ